jgi:hypothetical protein
VVTSRLTWEHQRSSEVRCEQETHGSALIPQGERARASAGVHGCAWACAGTGVERVLTVARPVAAARTASALALREGCVRKQNHERGCACDGEGGGTGITSSVRGGTVADTVFPLGSKAGASTDEWGSGSSPWWPLAEVQVSVKGRKGLDDDEGEDSGAGRGNRGCRSSRCARRRQV